MFRDLPKWLNGEIRIVDGIRFPLIVAESVMTRDDRLHIRCEELKPQIIKLLETRHVVRISELLNLLDADIFEIKFTLEELKKEGKVAFG